MTAAPVPPSVGASTNRLLGNEDKAATTSKDTAAEVRPQFYLDPTIALLKDQNSFLQGSKFTDFSLISDFFTSTHLKNSFEISSKEHVSDGFMIYPEFQEKQSVSFQTYFFKPDLHPCF